MFGQSKPVVFDPYGSSRRPRRRVPRWLMLLLAGAALGAGGVVLVQERYLPPRLSAKASAELRTSFEQADAERARLKNQLADAVHRLNAAMAENKTLTEQVATGREAVDQLRHDLNALVAALPPDPRGSVVQVRAARFEVDRGQLAYDVILSRDRAGGKPLSGVMQLVLTGDSARRAEDTVTLAPISISVGSYDSVRGNVAIPDGFRPRQTMIQVLDRFNGKRLGMRVINLK